MASTESAGWDQGFSRWGQLAASERRNVGRMKTVIHWFRRDLRLTDNTALNAAAKAGEMVMPVYILSEWKGQHHWVGPNRQEFLCACIESLAKNLEAHGGRLIVRAGAAEKELEKLVKETGAEAIFYNRDPDPFGRGVEARLEETAQRVGVKVFAHQDVAIHAADEVLTGSAQPYRVYSPYFKAWEKLSKPVVGPRLDKIHTPEDAVADPGALEAQERRHQDHRGGGKGGQGTIGRLCEPARRDQALR